MNNIFEILKNKILLLDGAFGTELHKEGFKGDNAAEYENIINEERIYNIHKKYIDSGSDIILTNSFGGSKLKLKEYNLDDRCYEINKKAALIAKKAIKENSSKKIFVAGDIGPSGRYIVPIGDLEPYDCINSLEEQIKGLTDGGVDFLFIETMSDILELKSTIIACKKFSNLPIFCSMTFEEDKRSVTGTDVVTYYHTVRALGVDAIGMNCSLGPKKMYEIFDKLNEISDIPVFIEPNAGMPILKDNQTFFPLTHDEFQQESRYFLEKGVNIIGGCCGTSPEFIFKLREIVDDYKPKNRKKNEIKVFTSRTKTVYVSDNNPLIIGERINPTARKKLSKQLRENNYSMVKEEAYKQIKAGANLLDVNVSVPNTDEKESMKNIISILSSYVDAPLCIDSPNEEIIEQALLYYPGIALINSTTADDEKLEKIFSLAKMYGANVVCLTMDHTGIKKEEDERFTLLEKIIKKAKEFNLDISKLYIDFLTLTVSTEPKSAKTTINCIKRLNDKYPTCNTILGVSNISYGMPNRNMINSFFFSNAIFAGLNSAIINPFEKEMKDAIITTNLLLNRDDNAKEYIKYQEFLKENFSTNETNSKTEKKINYKNDLDEIINKRVETLEYEELKLIFIAIVRFDKENIKEFIKKAIEKNIDLELIDNNLIDALRFSGVLYEKKIYFLPQMLESANTMKIAHEFMDQFKKDNKI
jgi:5-methyltetrahydrofolate--homocysteine methyltransferase